MLSCGHTFCTSCVQDFIVKGSTEQNNNNNNQDQNQEIEFQCPRDFKMIQISRPSVDELPKNYPLLKLALTKKSTDKQEGIGLSRVDELILCEACQSKDEDDSEEEEEENDPHAAKFRCLDCNMNMCVTMKKGHKNFSATSDHKVVSLAKFRENPNLLASTRLKCAKHEQEFVYFDKTTQQVLCPMCIASNVNDIQGNSIVPLEEAIPECREDLGRLLLQARENYEQLGHNIEKLMSGLESISDCATFVGIQIVDTFDKVSAFCCLCLCFCCLCVLF